MGWTITEFLQVSVNAEGSVLGILFFQIMTSTEGIWKY